MSRVRGEEEEEEGEDGPEERCEGNCRVKLDGEYGVALEEQRMEVQGRGACCTGRRQCCMKSRA